MSYYQHSEPTSVLFHPEEIEVLEQAAGWAIANRMPFEGEEGFALAVARMTLNQRLAELAVEDSA